MPVPAAWRADVVARDPQPLVLGGSGQHPLQELAVARLEIVLRIQRAAGTGNPIGERVANPLQLLQARDTRLAEPGRHGGIEIEARKCLAVEAGKLVLEPADLAPELGAREALVASNSKRGEHVSIEQILHEPGSSVDHPACAVP